jgi:hypothetical protein
MKYDYWEKIERMKKWKMIGKNRVFIDFSDLDSIEKAERKKNLLESKGYIRKKTEQVAFDKFIDFYSKKEKSTKKLKEVVK